MRLWVQAVTDVGQLMREEELRGRRAVSTAMQRAGAGLQAEWRRQILAAGLGNRLARTVRARNFPAQPSMSAAAWVYSRAPQIVSAFENGDIIRSRDGLFLAIPTAAAGTRGLGNKRITPFGWEQRTGMRLRFVYRTLGPSLLVADDARLTTRGMATMNRRRARQDGTRAGSATVPIFILVPQVTLRKRLDVAGAARLWAARAPALIAEGWGQA